MTKAIVLARAVSTGGILADGSLSAAEVTGLSTVATSGSYADLSNTPNIPSGVLTFTGDVTGSGTTGSSTGLTLANSGVTAGSYGTASAIPAITVDAKGRVTAVSTNAVSIPSGSISVTGGDITMSGTTGTAITNATLTNSGAAAGTYGTSGAVPQITVDAKGRITGVTSVNISSLGDTVINSSGTSAALRITQTGSGNALLVEDSTNPDATPFVVDASGNVVIGDTGLRTGPYGLQPIAQVSGATLNTSSGLFVDWANNDTTGPALIFAKAKSGVRGTQGAVINGTRLFFQTFSGSDGTNFIPAAQIDVYVDGTPGTNDMPGRLIFSTTADGASSPTERMRIDSAGRVGIGGTPTSSTPFRMSKTATGNTDQYIIYNDSQIQSDVTSSAEYYVARANFQAATFTLTNLSYFKTSQAAFGSATVTNQYGFFADSSLTGATNNYGFYSNIASGSGRWNFYANGTADNYFAGRVGFGGTSLGGAFGVVSNQITLTGGVDQAAYMALNTIASDVTTGVAIYKSQPTTQAASFTLTSLYHFLALQTGFGAGSTVSNQYGFRASSNLTGATNNYGFYSDIASGSNRWNFYANGTADNYFAGAVGIGAAPASYQKLAILGTYPNDGSTSEAVSVRGNMPAISTASAFRSRPTTASGTLSNLYHFNANPNTFTGTVTNQFGFIADSSLTAATNNYGFYSNIASGTGRWNFYANGTAANYFGGNVTIVGSLTVTDPVVQQSDIGTGANEIPLNQYLGNLAYQDASVIRVITFGYNLLFGT